MISELAIGAMDVFALLGRQFDLATRLNRDRCALAVQSNDTALFAIGRVAVAINQALEQRFDAVRTRKGQGGTVLDPDHDLFVLAAYAPLLRWLGAAFEVPDEVLAVLN